MKINTEITTKEQAEKLIEKLKNFNEPLLFGRWIKDDNVPKWLAFYDKESNVYFGIRGNGYWFKDKIVNNNPNNCYSNRYATDQEILDGLSEMALKLGYKKGVRVDFTNIFPEYVSNNTLIEGSKFEVFANRLYLDNNCIMKDGNLATIIKQEPTTLESLEKRIAALESKLK